LWCNRKVNVTGAGAGTPVAGLEAAGRLPELAAQTHGGHPVSGHDRASVWLERMASPPMLHLLHGIESRVAGALEAKADTRETAVLSVARAAHAVEISGGRGQRIPAGVDPQMVLALANRFIETGQIANYFRAAELGRVVLAWHENDEAPELSRRELRLRAQSRNALAGLWRRAPLLVLLTGWMTAGIVTGLLLGMLRIPAYESSWAFDLWALGFLGIVVVQFAVVALRGFTRLGESKWNSSPISRTATRSSDDPAASSNRSMGSR